MLTNRQQFQAEFLCKAARAGLTPDQAAAVANNLADLVENRAKAADASLLDLPGKALGGAVDVGAAGVKGLLGVGKTIGLPLAIAGPFVGGMTAGLGYRKMTDVEDDDIDEAKLRELTATYQQLAMQARRRELMKTVGRR